jgi:hypothetical protein
MKHLGMLTFLLIASFTASKSQTAIEPTRRYEGTVEYQKTQQPCTILEFNYPERDLDNAVDEYLEKRGARIKTQKGFNVVKGVKLHENENRYFDVYYKVEGKGKGDKASSTLYFIVAEPGENILLRDGKSGESAKAAASVGAASFFSSMGSQVGAYDLDQRIKLQEQELAMAEKRKTDLQKRKEKLEKELNETTQDLARQYDEVERAKTILEQIKALKKN